VCLLNHGLRASHEKGGCTALFVAETSINVAGGVPSAASARARTAPADDADRRHGRARSHAYGYVFVLGHNAVGDREARLLVGVARQEADTTLPSASANSAKTAPPLPPAEYCLSAIPLDGNGPEQPHFHEDASFSRRSLEQSICREKRPPEPGAFSRSSAIVQRLRQPSSQQTA
jgi:hypothetical protein